MKGRFRFQIQWLQVTGLVLLAVPVHAGTVGWSLLYNGKPVIQGQSKVSARLAELDAMEAVPEGWKVRRSAASPNLECAEGLPSFDQRGRLDCDWTIPGNHFRYTAEIVRSSNAKALPKQAASPTMNKRL